MRRCMPSLALPLTRSRRTRCVREHTNQSLEISQEPNRPPIDFPNHIATPLMHTTGSSLATITQPVTVKTPPVTSR